MTPLAGSRTGDTGGAASGGSLTPRRRDTMALWARRSGGTRRLALRTGGWYATRASKSRADDADSSLPPWIAAAGTLRVDADSSLPASIAAAAGAVSSTCSPTGASTSSTDERRRRRRDGIRCMPSTLARRCRSTGPRKSLAERGCLLSCAWCCVGNAASAAWSSMAGNRVSAAASLCGCGGAVAGVALATDGAVAALMRSNSTATSGRYTNCARSLAVGKPHTWHKQQEYNENNSNLPRNS